MKPFLWLRRRGKKKQQLVSLRRLGGEEEQTYYECTTRVHPVASDATQTHQARREGDLEGGVKIKRKEDGKFVGGGLDSNNAAKIISGAGTEARSH